LGVALEPCCLSILELVLDPSPPPPFLTPLAILDSEGGRERSREAGEPERREHGNGGRGINADGVGREGGSRRQRGGGPARRSGGGVAGRLWQLGWWGEEEQAEPSRCRSKVRESSKRLVCRVVLVGPTSCWSRMAVRGHMRLRETACVVFAACGRVEYDYAGEDGRLNSAASLSGFGGGVKRSGACLKAKALWLATLLPLFLDQD
jgi:hypothetical protein